MMIFFNQDDDIDGYIKGHSSNKDDEECDDNDIGTSINL